MDPLPVGIAPPVEQTPRSDAFAATSTRCEVVEPEINRMRPEALLAIGGTIVASDTEVYVVALPEFTAVCGPVNVRRPI